VNPVLIRHIEGVGVQEAAACLGATTAQVKQWLESGALKGYRPTGGRWKSTRKDLITFSRSQRLQ
jgi:excisionase family DNA binding protein